MTRALTGLTRRGSIFLILGAVVVAASVLVGNRELLQIGILLLVLPLISLVVALRSRVQLSAARSIEPPRVPAGQAATVRLRLANLSRIPTGVLLVEDALPYALGTRPRFVLDHVWSKFRRDVTYDVRPVVRGRYSIGPLNVRVTDPFGLVELSRSFSEIRSLIVTPTVVKLPTVRLIGEWDGSGESRPRAVAYAGEEDATVRAYRTGDDMRRVHWRATAHHGELMVRREEQPWQSRATLLLDNRTRGHAGEGVDTSLEWAVVAAASTGVHLADRGYAVRLVTDHGGTISTAWHDSAGGSTDSTTPLLDALAVVSPQRDASVGRWPDLLAGAESASGLLVAVLGRLSPAEARVVAGLRHGSTAAIAILLDVATWTTMTSRKDEQVRQAETVVVLKRAGWSVIEGRRGESIATVWQRLGLDPRATSIERARSHTGAA